MSLSLKFSPNIVSHLLRVIPSNEVTFHQSSSVEVMPPGIVASVDVTDRLYEDYRDDEYHFKGRISLPNEPSPCDVVVKIVLGHNESTLQSYTQEAKFYQDHLCGKKSLYGNGVPRIYGYYETKLTWRSARRDILIDCACIVFQYYGSSELSWSSGAGISDFGSKAVKLLFEVHKSGVRHNLIGLNENIKCLDGEPFFTDFSEACEHDCPDKEFKLPPRLFDVDEDTLKCGEIRDFFEDLRSLVAPKRFFWYGYDIDYNRVESLESIFQHKRRPSFAERVPLETQWACAVEAWEFLCANWSSYHEGKAPSVGDTSFATYKARHNDELDIVYSDDDWEYYYSDEEEESEI